MHGPTPTAPPTLSPEERDALFRRFDVWVRALCSGSGPKKFHLPTPDSDRDRGQEQEQGQERAPRPLCRRPVASGRWVTKDPACFPPGWVSLCGDCAEIITQSPDRFRDNEEQRDRP